MDINVTLKIEGLEPLASAINNLATAYSTSGTAAAAVIEKAKGKPKADSKPAAIQPAAETEATTATQAPAASETVAESPSEGKPAGTAATSQPTSAEQETTDAVQESASPSSVISDEALRAVAGAAAKKDKEKVRQIVAKYAEKISEIPNENRAVVIKELEAV